MSDKLKPTMHGMQYESKARKELKRELDANEEPNQLEWSRMSEDERIDNLVKTCKVKYNDKFGPMLIEHMREGKSYETFGLKINVLHDVLVDWEFRHKNWYRWKCAAYTEALNYWESLLSQATNDTIKSNATLLIFKLKNSFPERYRDKVEVEHTGNNTVFVINTGIERQAIDTTCGPIEDAELL